MHDPVLTISPLHALQLMSKGASLQPTKGLLSTRWRGTVWPTLHMRVPWGGEGQQGDRRSAPVLTHPSWDTRTKPQPTLPHLAAAPTHERADSRAASTRLPPRACLAPMSDPNRDQRPVPAGGQQAPQTPSHITVESPMGGGTSLHPPTLCCRSKDIMGAKWANA